MAGSLNCPWPWYPHSRYKLKKCIVEKFSGSTDRTIRLIFDMFEVTDIKNARLSPA